MKFTKIPETTFQNIQLNAGILLDGFNPATGVIGNILGATTGGFQFSDDPEYKDYGEDVDNCPKNTMELKKLDGRAVSMSGNFVTVTAVLAKVLAGAADIDGQNDIHVIPRNDILASDFQDIWWVGDYSDVNTGDNAGFVAIHVMNALNTTGFKIQSSDKNKGQLAFNFQGHYSIEDQDKVPYEVYVQQGSGSATPSIYLNKHSLTVAKNGTASLTATTVPAGATVTWTSGNSSVASVSDGVITAGSSAGNTIIKAAITIDGVTYDDTCTVVVTA